MSSEKSSEKKNKWTVMVHLAGDNNLSEECVFALAEMSRIGSGDGVAVIAQLDTGVHENTDLFIEPGTTPGQINRKLNESRAARLARKAKALARSRPSSAAPDAQNGVWLEFRGARYYSDGAAAPFDAKRFTRVGEYHGFPVYRAKEGNVEAIWVAVLKDEGPVAPYVKR